jgi:hypothetical protein
MSWQFVKKGYGSCAFCRGNTRDAAKARRFVSSGDGEDYDWSDETPADYARSLTAEVNVFEMDWPNPDKSRKVGCGVVAAELARGERYDTNEYLTLSNWHPTMLGGEEYACFKVRFPVNFCPICGRDLTPRKYREKGE